MLYWTLRSLLVERASVLASAIGIALALLLALYLEAVFRGEAKQIVAFIERTPGEVWVLQRGIEDLHMTQSTISENTIVQVRRTPGVSRLNRLLYRAGLMGEPGHEQFVYVAAIPDEPTFRNQWQRATGWTAPEKGGIVIPEPLARAQGLDINDEIRVDDMRYRVTGLSQGTFSMANSLMFMNERDARRHFGIGDGASVLLVEGEAGLDPKTLAKRIESETDAVRAVPREVLIQNDYNLALEMGGALIGMMSLVGMVIAALIVIFTAYAFVSVRTPELAIAKALGASQSQLVKAVMLQTALVALLGGVVAIITIGPLEIVLSTWVPKVAVDFSAASALQLSFAVLIISELAALIPTTYVLRVDPALVFRG